MWGVGIIAYILLTGEHPFEEDMCHHFSEEMQESRKKSCIKHTKLYPNEVEKLLKEPEGE